MKRVLKSLMVALMIFIGVSVYLPRVEANVISASVANVAMASANIEYSYTIPNGVGAISVQLRGANDVKLSFTAGESGTTYFTLKSGSVYFETVVSSFKNTLYFQSTAASQVLEIILWSD